MTREKHMFDLLMNQMEDDVFILDPQGRIVDLNRFAAESRGVSPDACAGRYCGDLDASLPCCDGANACAFGVARDTGKRAESVDTMLQPDGRMRYLHTHCFPIQDQQGVLSQILFIRRDVTEEQQIEQRFQQSEKMAAIGELSTYMAHEIRNPLFSIGGFANALLRNSALDEDAREKALIIFEESRRLDIILTNILNFARPTEQELGEFDVEPMLYQTMSLMTMGGFERGITTEVDVEPALPKALGDAENLKQCLINLVKNSLEAMPQGGWLGIRAWRRHGNVQIDVEDTGVGIAPELMEQVFSPFYSSKGEGAGLGLAMIRKVIEDMGGKVFLKSIQGRGTTVSLLLPAAFAV